MESVKSNRTVNIKYTVFQFIYWMMNSAIYSFAAVFLLNANFNNRAIGWVLASANIISIILQPLLSQQIIGRFKVPVKKVITILTLITIIDMVPLVANQQSFGILFVAYTLATLINLTMQPLVNALGFAYMSQGYNINFGISRGAGSLSYAITSYLLGYFLAKFTPLALPIIMAGLALAFLLSLFILPQGETELADQEKKDLHGYSLCIAVRKYPFIGSFFLAVSFLFIFHTIISTSITQILNHYGGNSQNVGMALFIAGICELPAMFGFTQLMRLKSSCFWLNFAATFFVVRSLVVLFAPSLLAVEGSQFLQAVSFALFIPASSYMVNQYMEQKDNVLGQTVITAGMTCGGIISNIIGGYLLDLLGVFYLMLFATFCAVIGMCLTFFSVSLAEKAHITKTI